MDIDKKSIFLDSLSIEDIEKVRIWRNKTNGVLRTPYMLTKEQQREFYNEFIINRKSNSRFFAIKTFDYNSGCNKLVGMGGFTNIEFENGLAEISIIINDQLVNKGIGNISIMLLLNEGFNKLRLENVYGECYKCNDNIGFWEKQIKKYNATKTILVNRKYFKGKFYNSLYFNFNKKDFNENFKE